MSRTDKTRPSWVREYDRTEKRVEHHRHVSWRDGLIPCDLHLPAPQSRREAWDRNCGYWVAYPHRWRYTAVPRWFRKSTWFAPERVRERDTLRDAAREYNAHGELNDFDFGCPQHRHRSSWYWD